MKDEQQGGRDECWGRSSKINRNIFILQQATNSDKVNGYDFSKETENKLENSTCEVFWLKKGGEGDT